MESLRLDTLAAQVVAWHNRHPLARRITAAQVQSLGYVVLPGMQGADVPRATPEQVTDTAAKALAATAAVATVANVQAADVRAAVPHEADAEPEPLAVAAPAAPATPSTAQIHAAETLDAAAARSAAPPVAQSLAEPVAEPAAGQTADQGADQGADAPVIDAPPAGSLRARLAARLPGEQPVGGAAPAPGARVGLPLPGSAAVEPAAAAHPSSRSLAQRATQPAGHQTAHQTAHPAAQPLAPFRLVFSEAVLEHTKTGRLLKWAQQQARLLTVPLPQRAAVRHVLRDAALSVPLAGAAERPVELVLRTATLELGRRRVRLLVGPGDDPAVLGPRVWSLPRLALACLPLLLLPATAGLAWRLGAQSARESLAVASLSAAVPAPVSASAPVASASAAAAGASALMARQADAAASAVSSGASAPLKAAAASALDAAHAVHQAQGDSPDAGHAAAAANNAFAAVAARAAASAAAAQAAAANEPPDDVDPTLGRVELPPLGPLFADPRFEPTRQRRLAARAARGDTAAAAALRPADAAPSGAPAPGQAKAAGGPLPVPLASPTASRMAAASAAAPGAALPPAPAPSPPAAPAAGYALTTRLLRTAAESEQIQSAMRTLLAQTATRSALVQRLPVGDDWRVMGGPFTDRAAAERARAQLQARGVKTEVTEIPPAAAVVTATSSGR